MSLSNLVSLVLSSMLEQASKSHACLFSAKMVCSQFHRSQNLWLTNQTMWVINKLLCLVGETVLIELFK